MLQSWSPLLGADLVPVWLMEGVRDPRSPPERGRREPAVGGPEGKATVAQFDLSERIDFQSGDFNHDPLGGPYDAAWLSQILHSNSPEECETLIKRTVETLEPGGMILVHDFLLNDTMDGPEFPALFSLNMLINNHGRNYSQGEVHDMLELAGCKNIQRLDYQGPNNSGIMCGIKK